MILTNDNTYETSRRQQLKIDEYISVEHPFMEQLKELGWKNGANEVIELKMQQQPSESYRTSFSEVVLMPKLRKALKQINAFLTDSQIDEVTNSITTYEKGSTLLENNERIFNLMVGGTSVARNEQTGEQSPSVRYIDFDHPENNIFTAISQFKVAIPGTCLLYTSDAADEL